MASSNSSKDQKSFQLLPFQENFIREFLRENSPTAVQLIVPTGGGKGVIASNIVKKLSETVILNRILLTAPPVLLDQWRYTFEKLDTELQVNVITRRRYLNMESLAPVGASPWPQRSIVIISASLAKRKDMQASLTNEKWDLVIFDESDSIAGGLDDLYNNFVSTGAAGRILALDSLGQSVLAGAAKKEIKLQQIVDEKGNEDRFLTKYIEFESSPEELKLNREINRFQKQLKEMEKAGNSIASTIVKRSLSSTRALEKSLIRFQSNWQPVRNRLAHSQVVDTNFLENFFVQEKYLFGAGEDKLDGELEFKQRARRTLFSEHAKATYVYRHIQRGEKPEEIAIRTGQTLDEITEYINLYEDVEVFYEQKSKLFVQLFAGIERLLEMVDELSTDTKGQTFTDYLVEIIKEQRCNHICVITYYEDTAQYLNTLLESVSVESRLVTSAVSPEDKENILVDYSAKGGILIFSIAALQGIELKADLCINYDEALVKEIEQYMHMVWIRSREVRTTFQMLAFKNKSADSINLPIGISSVNPHHF